MNQDKPARTLGEILDEHLAENSRKLYENRKVDYNSLTLWEKKTLFHLLYDKVRENYSYNWQSELKFLPDCSWVYRMSDIEQMMDWVKDLEVIELHDLSNEKKYVKVKTIDWSEMFQYYLYLFKEKKIDLQPLNLKEYIIQFLDDEFIDGRQEELVAQCKELINKLEFKKI